MHIRKRESRSLFLWDAYAYAKSQNEPMINSENIANQRNLQSIGLVVMSDHSHPEKGTLFLVFSYNYFVY